MPLALHARQWRPDPPSETTSDRHVNMGRFFRHPFPSGEEVAEDGAVPDCVSLGARPQWSAGPSFPGNASILTPAASCAAVAGPTPGTVSRQR